MAGRGVRAATLALILVTSLILAAGCTFNAKRTPLSVFFAGSLIIPFGDLEKAYEAKHPNVDVLMEGHGSIQVMRHVTDLHELIDVVVTADEALIPSLMYQTAPGTGKPYADWYISFTTNRLALAYTERSAHANDINASNWFQVVTRPGVRLGIADPRFDAAGYRALMALQLAKAAYGKPTVFEDVLMGRFRTAITVRQENDQAVIHVPEIVEPKPGSGIVMRGASIQLIALLESGDLDYAFEYESVIAQHGLRIVQLPDTINLGSAQHAADYQRVRVRLDFQRFASVRPDFIGDVIRYAVTIPNNAPQHAEAIRFTAFLLGPEGQAIMARYQQPLISPLRADNIAAVPAALQPLVVARP